MEEKKLVDIYPYRLEKGEPVFLLLRRAGGKIYSGQWRMIGGKVKYGEEYWQTALRELHEETGLKPEEFWTVPTINHFYEHSTDKILLIPAFAVQIPHDSTVSLDDEHSEYRWITENEALDLISWPEQKRIISLITKIIKSGQILDDWRILSYHT